VHPLLYPYASRLRGGSRLGLAIVIAAIGGFIYYGGSGKLPFSFGSGSSVADQGTEVAFVELAHGTYSEVSIRKNYLINTPEQLRTLWSMTDAQGDVPNVDFGQYEVLAVFAGDEPTSGYAIAVSDVRDSDAQRFVSVTLSTPGASCVLAPAESQPYQIIEVPVTTLPFAHQDSSKTISCLN